MAGEITLQQMFQVETITGIVSKFKTPLSLLQNTYGVGIGGAYSENQPGRNIGWDLFDKTRQIARGRAPNTGPGRSEAQKMGHVSAQVLRLHEAVPIYYEYIARTRPAGSQWGTVDASGQQYIRRQLETYTQKFRNTREFLLSRMFRGKVGVEIDGDNWNLCEGDNGAAVAGSDGVTPTFVIDFQVPSTNLGRLDLETGSDIIQSSWADPGTQIVKQCNEINASFERLHGRPLRHVWINTDTYNYMILNSEMQAIGGAVNKVWDSLTGRTDKSAEGIPDSGWNVQFKAMPLYTFHVYDGVLSFYEDGTSTSLTSKLIPNNRAIFTPDPSGDWLKVINGSEYVIERHGEGAKEVYGFHNWSTPTIDPPAIDLKFLDNFLFALQVPRCVAYGEVIF
jgi:hypothetical protein